MAPSCAPAVRLDHPAVPTRSLEDLCFQPTVRGIVNGVKQAVCHRGQIDGGPPAWRPAVRQESTATEVTRTDRWDHYEPLTWAAAVSLPH